MKVDVNLKNVGYELAVSHPMEISKMINHFSFAMREHLKRDPGKLDEISKCLDANSRIILEKLVSHLKEAA